jgi:anhydro-N-acetylmuramic acid kinase
VSEPARGTDGHLRLPRIRNGPATLQIGEPAWLCEALRVPVVNNFRATDLAAGGQGAPLATLFHRVVFGQPGRFVCVNNLGGISNVTALDWRQPKRLRIVAFDTGPANVLLDLACRHLTGGRRPFDRGGEWAANGTVQPDLVGQWLEHSFFRRRPPKSTGRELFGEPFLGRILRTPSVAQMTRFDLLANLTEFTARSIALGYRRHLGGWPQQVVLAGGGAANPTLVRRIIACLSQTEPPPEVVTSDALGWPQQAIEPAAFALLAFCRMHALPGNVPETTGAKRPVLLGQITAP